jgi:DNA-binding transcriptional MerR regulator
MDWAIHEVARLTGTTSRTLRHYDAIGLLEPSRTGANGTRYYNERALARLQRILVMRHLGVGLAAIAEVIDGNRHDRDALESHVHELRDERNRIDRQIASVESTIEALREGKELMPEKMFDGFDHTQYREEVESRWSPAAYADGDRWWRAKSPEERAEWRAAQQQLAHDWATLARAGADPAGENAQALANRHAAWLAAIPGTPGAGTGRPAKAYLLGLGAMYVGDARFSANYGGVGGAAFVRDALAVYAERNL